MRIKHKGSCEWLHYDISQKPVGWPKFNTPKGPVEPPVDFGQQARIVSDFTQDFIKLRSLDPFDEEGRSLELLVGTKYLETVTKGSFPELDVLRTLHERGEFNKELTTAYLLYSILKCPISALERELSLLDEATHKLEDLALSNEQISSLQESLDSVSSSESSQDVTEIIVSRPVRTLNVMLGDKYQSLDHHEQLLFLRRGLAYVRKRLHGFELLMQRLCDPNMGAYKTSKPGGLHADAMAYYGVLTNHVSRALSKASTLRDIHEGLEGFLLNSEVKESKRLAEISNVMLLRLTFASFVFVPLSLVAAVFGMNVVFPWSVKAGWSIAVDIMLLFGLTIAWIFERQRRFFSETFKSIMRRAEKR